MFSSRRSSTEVLEIIEAAKLHPNDLDPRVQEIHFSTNFTSNDFRLLELDAATEKYLESNNSLVLRGMPDDSAVLCTADTTYELKEAETSNSLLLTEYLIFMKDEIGSGTGKKASITPRKAPVDASGFTQREILQKNINFVANTYLEMRKVKPYLGRIREILERSPFKGFEEEDENDKPHRVSMDDLLNLIPASRAEIQKYLSELKILELDGQVRLAESDYLYKVMSFVLGIVDENGWKKNAIAKDTVLTQLRGLYPENILEKVFTWFFTPISSDVPMEEDDLVMDENLYAFNEMEICRLFGEVLLKRGSQFSYREFVKSWQDSVPPGVKVSLSHLKGIAIVDQSVTPPVIRYFPEFNLPPNIQDRLVVLFSAKEKWKHDEIMPYVINLAPNEQSAAGLLTKYCRSMMIDGCKTYCSKYIKCS